MAESQKENKMPFGLKLIVIFLFLAFILSSLAGISLIKPGTILDMMWQSKKAELESMKPYVLVLGYFLVILGISMLVSGIGLIKKQTWAWWIALIVFSTNGISDLVSSISRAQPESLIGVLIVGLLILYLFKKNVKAYLQ